MGLGLLGVQGLKAGQCTVFFYLEFRGFRVRGSVRVQGLVGSAAAPTNRKTRRRSISGTDEQGRTLLFYAVRGNRDDSGAGPWTFELLRAWFGGSGFRV